MRRVRTLVSEKDLSTLIPGDLVILSLSDTSPKGLRYFKLTPEGRYLFMEEKEDHGAYYGWECEARYISFIKGSIYLPQIHTRIVRIDASLGEYNSLRSLLEE